MREKDYDLYKRAQKLNATDNFVMYDWYWKAGLEFPIPPSSSSSSSSTSLSDYSYDYSDEEAI